MFLLILRNNPVKLTINFNIELPPFLRNEEEDTDNKIKIKDLLIKTEETNTNTVIFMYIRRANLPIPTDNEQLISTLSKLEEGEIKNKIFFILSLSLKDDPELIIAKSTDNKYNISVMQDASDSNKFISTITKMHGSIITGGYNKLKIKVKKTKKTKKTNLKKPNVKKSKKQKKTKKNLKFKKH